MNNSVVRYSQQITEWLGMERFKRYVAQFRYGNEDVSGAPGKNDGLTHAWLTSSLKISPREQLDFLRRIVRRELPVSAHAYEMTNRITAVTVLANGWEVHGKTGTGIQVNADGLIDSTHQVGWFIGWATKGDRTLVFAHCLQERAGESVRAGLLAREAFMARLPGFLDSLRL
jgi:beta-lactamase class D